LPATSSTDIPVNWWGDDPGGSGVVYYDIYVSVDGGPFTLWLRHTPDTAATYPAQVGHHYGFNSAATDYAGNAESPRLVADAETYVPWPNRPPRLDPIPNTNIIPGDTFSRTVTATDPDLPNDELSFSLAEGPAGAQIDRLTGLLTWPTGPGHNDTANLFTVAVTDRGLLSDTKSFVVIVCRTNTPPSLAPTPNPIVVWTNEWATFTNVASDPDTPGQTLSFGLCGGPTNTDAMIDPASGVFRWFADGARADTTNRFCVYVVDDGMPIRGATQTLAVVVRAINTPPYLAPIPNPIVVWTDEWVTVTNVASDADTPPQTLRFSLCGSPAGADATVDPVTGLFRWLPGAGWANTTNAFCVSVADNGTPSLSATRQFEVMVHELVQETPVLGLGSTTLVSPALDGSVPLTIYHSPDLVELTFNLSIPGSRLTGVAWTNLQPEVAWASLEATGAGRYEAWIQTSPGKTLWDTERIVDLRFTWAANHSGAVPLLLSDVTAVRRDGRLVPQVRAESGRVVVVRKEPVLDVHVHTNGHRFLTLYGLPDTNIVNYVIESSTDLLQWDQHQVVTMPTNKFRMQVDLSSADRAIFFRVRDPRP
jgi:hypothetical protein